MKRILLIAIIFTVFTGTYAEENGLTPQGDNITFGGNEFFSDYVTYKGVDGETYLEVYLGIPIAGLKAQESEEGNVYLYSAAIRLTDIATGEVAGWDIKSLPAVLPPEDMRQAPYTLEILKASVPPGDYSMDLGAGDLVSGETNTQKIELSLPDYHTEFSVSAIEIASAIAPSEEIGKFYKNGYVVIPNPTLLVKDDPGEFNIYYEIYNFGQVNNPVTIKYVIQQKNGKVLLRTSEEVTGTTDKAKAKSFDLKGFPAGSYEIIIETFSGEDSLCAVRKSFIIYHERTAEELALLKSKYLPFTKSETEEIRYYLGYIASPEEIQGFDKMPPEEQPIFVEYFWKKNDPTPETETNEFKEAFFERFDYANTHFNTTFRDGIDTDRGKIYLRFGEPDEIVREAGGLPSQIDFEDSSWQTKPFEVWEYYGVQGGDLAWFFFSDRNGDGSYWLESSSLPGYGMYGDTKPTDF